MNLNVLTSIIFPLIVTTAVACSKTSDPVNQTPTLSVSSASVEFSEKDSSQSLQVESNSGQYDVSIPAGISWCTHEKNGKTLNIRVSAMTSATAKRTTEVTISVGSGPQKIQKIIAVAQNRQWKLIWEENFDTDGPVNNSRCTLVGKGSSDWNKYFMEDGRKVARSILWNT